MWVEGVVVTSLWQAVVGSWGQRPPPRTLPLPGQFSDPSGVMRCWPAGCLGSRFILWRHGARVGAREQGCALPLC